MRIKGMIVLVVLLKIEHCNILILKRLSYINVLIIEIHFYETVHCFTIKLCKFYFLFLSLSHLFFIIFMIKNCSCNNYEERNHSIKKSNKIK